ncbi:MAG: hypothetical protein GKR94_20305 [Gammaproteobacteria bacterium]|nr:hypothetical protein [Gammaproteobacteria bacterium]
MAAVEQMLPHVDMNPGRVCPIQPRVFEALRAIRTEHKKLPAAEFTGHTMG